MQDTTLLIFDWDGTLMDSGEKISVCFQKTAADFNLRLPSSDEIRNLIGLSLMDMVGDLFPGTTLEKTQQFIARYREYWLYYDDTEMPLYAGVESGLEQLETAGYLLAVATGKSRAGLDRALRTTNLQSRFVYTRCADESRAKPHPQMLLDVLDKTGHYAKQALMIGDTTYDMEMAGNADVNGLAVSYGSHSERRLKIVSNEPVQASFPDLVRYLMR